MKRLLLLSSLFLVACASSTVMDHAGTGHESLSMDDMTDALKGKTGDAFDRAFIDMMIPHHQGAIDMAKLAKASGKHAEILRMADDIITAQEREIATMKQWQKDWGYAK